MVLHTFHRVFHMRYVNGEKVKKLQIIVSFP